MNAAEMIGYVGYMGLTGAFFVCACLILIATLSHFKRFRVFESVLPILIHSQTVLLTAAVSSLFTLLNMEAYQFEQVFSAVEQAMPAAMRIGGLWSGQAASLLFWSFIMSLMISLSALLNKNEAQSRQYKTVVLVLSFTMIFFLAPDVFVANPFAKLFRTASGEIVTAIFPPEKAELLLPLDGQGMNPSLRHAAMLLHPPTLYAGLIGPFLPYAFALAALLHRDTSNDWIKLLFPVTLVSWILLTIGMILGSWWAYTILGWGGYWGWDAVEISGLLPWMLGFGLLHAMRFNMRDGSMRVWVNTLAIFSVILILFGILITRSGILESVHAYASGPMGPILTVLIVSHLCAVILGIAFNFHRSEGKLPRKKVALTQSVNLLFFWCMVGLVAIFLYGQTLPLTSQLFIGEARSFNAADYERISAPLLFLLLILLALCPFTDLFQQKKWKFTFIVGTLGILAVSFPIIALFHSGFSIALIAGFWATGFLCLSWIYTLFADIFLPILKGTSFNQWKRKLGMIVIHLGFAVMTIGIIGVETMTEDASFVLEPGQAQAFNDISIEYNLDQSRYDERTNPSFTAAVSLARNGRDVDTLDPAIYYYTKTGSAYSVPAIKPGFWSDVQIILAEFPLTTTSPVNIHLAVFPLISWIWAGGGLMAGGGMISLLLNRPSRRVRN